VALFGYIALLDAGLLAVARHRRWFYLTALAAAGTVIMQIGWASEFFEREQYFLGNKVLIPMTILLFFNGLWLAATKLARSRKEDEWCTSLSAAALSTVAFAFAFYFLGFESLGARPWLLFSFAFVIDSGVLLLTRLDRRVVVAQPLAGGVMFLLLGVWLGLRATNELLAAALVFTLVFAIFHALLPLVLQRRAGDAAPPRLGSLPRPQESRMHRHRRGSTRAGAARADVAPACPALRPARARRRSPAWFAGHRRRVARVQWAGRRARDGRAPAGRGRAGAGHRVGPARAVAAGRRVERPGRAGSTALPLRTELRGSAGSTAHPHPTGHPGRVGERARRRGRSPHRRPA